MSTKDDIKIFKLSFKENNSLKLYYIKTIWKIDSLNDLSGSDEDIVCELIVTNCSSFWTRNVTLGDLKLTKPNNIRVEKIFCEATYAALSGVDSYENQKLSCQINVEDDNAEISWNWLMNEPETTSMPLKFTLGTVSLHPVSQSETVKMWQEWMNFFIEERNQFVTNRDNYETRIDDLAEINNQMKGKVEVMITDKDRNQKELTEKFKKVLNRKKRKAKKLINTLNEADAIVTSNEPLKPPDDSNQDDRQESPRKKSRSSRVKRTPSKKSKLGKIIESNEGESAEQQGQQEQSEQPKGKEKQEEQQPQETESVLTRTFRGQVIKSRSKRLTRKSASTLDQILEKDAKDAKDDNSSQDPSGRRSGGSSRTRK